MTKKELSQLYWLNREIEQDKERLQELESKAAYPGINYKQSGRAVGCVSDRVGNAAILIYEQKRLIECKLERLYIEQTRLYRYISSIDDSLIRQIVQLRYVNGLTWQQIAFETNNPYESTVRRLHNRFLSKTER